MSATARDYRGPWWRMAPRSFYAGLDPDACFRGFAGRHEPFDVWFPGLGPVHFVTDAEGAREILTLPRQALSAPTPNPIAPIVGPLSVILASGEHHSRTRKILTPAFNGSRMRARAAAMAEAVAEEIDTWHPGDKVALHATGQSITLRIIIRAVLGIEDREVARDYTRVVTALMNANTAPLMLLPFLRKEIAGRGPWARLIGLRDELDEMLTREITARRNDGDSGHADVMSALLSQTDDDGRPFDHDDLLQQLRTLIIAGHDTTASALAWAFYHIHREPSVRERLMTELADDPSPVEMNDLPYLSAVIAETLRMHPSVPIVLRRLIEPMTLSGIHRPADSVVGIAVPAVHFDPEVWNDPDRFTPQRFLTRNPTPFEYLPYGGGYRRCVGAGFAKYELAVSIGTILRAAHLQMPDRERRRRPPRSVPRGIATVPMRDIRLEVLTRRDGAAAAPAGRRGMTQVSSRPAEGCATPRRPAHG